MILVDTSGLYALANRRDAHHATARGYFQEVYGREVLALPVPVLVEAMLFIESRLGAPAARRLWGDVLSGVFALLDVPHDVLVLASAIDRRYADAALGFVDCTCLALCERHRITTVFTYDRRHFSLYRPTFTRALTLVP